MANHIKAKIWGSGYFKQKDYGFLKNRIIATLPKTSKLRISKS